MMRRTLALMIAAIALPATAQTIYKCTDAGGGTLISNSRVDKNCKALATSPDNGASSGSSAPRTASRPVGAAANPTPAGFPRVQEDTQKSRDTDRRHILEQELAGEQRNLDLARKELAEQEAQRASADRLVTYRDRVGQHERNIQAIQKEMKTLR
jgi:hypothetical protein